MSFKVRKRPILGWGWRNLDHHHNQYYKLQATLKARHPYHLQSTWIKDPGRALSLITFMVRKRPALGFDLQQDLQQLQHNPADLDQLGTATAATAISRTSLDIFPSRWWHHQLGGLETGRCRYVSFPLLPLTNTTKHRGGKTTSLGGSFAALLLYLSPGPVPTWSITDWRSSQRQAVSATCTNDTNNNNATVSPR